MASVYVDCTVDIYLVKGWAVQMNRDAWLVKDKVMDGKPSGMLSR